MPILNFNKFYYGCGRIKKIAEDNPSPSTAKQVRPSTLDTASSKGISPAFVQMYKFSGEINSLGFRVFKIGRFV